MKRLFLLDAYALIYRAYYALIRSPRISSTGLNTSAIFGFVNTLEELLNKEKPTHLAVCFDPHGPTFRHEEYAPYKAQREKQPEDISLALPYIKSLLEAYRIPVVEVPGFEADDVIGTLSRIAEAEGFETYMMTPDKDYGQLVTDRVLMYRPSLRGVGFEIRGPQQVCEKYGISSPAQVADLLALEGDASDNIPGCPGVGEKTAVNLIREYGTVENLISHAAEIKGAVGRKVADNAEKLLLFKRLVTIRTDVPLPEGISPEAFARKKEDVEGIMKIFKELEFRTLIDRVVKRTSAGNAPAQGSAEGSMGSLFDLEPETEGHLQVLDCPAGEYTLADTPEAINKLLESAKNLVGVAFDSEGPEAMSAHLKGIAVAVSQCSASYIPLFGERRKELLEAVAPLFAGGITLCGADIKRMMLLIRREGIEWKAPYFDIQIAHYLIDAEATHTLPRLMAHYLQMESPLFPSDAKKWYDPQPLSPDERIRRFCQEADTVLRLHAPLSRGIEEECMTSLLKQIELPLVRVLANMEWAGVRIDSQDLNTLRLQYNERLEAMRRQAYELAGEPFNLGSPTQVGRILFDKLNLDPKAKRTSKGAYSTTEKILEKLRHNHPIVGLILDIRKLSKLVATYLDTLPSLVNPTTGKIHTTFNQTVTATGRISSTNPNLQNIPIRSDDGREIRRAFVPDMGCVIMSADYSQIELRLIASMSGDKDMIEAFREGDDIHRATAAKIYHLPLEEVSENQRRNAKTANFGTIYGISAFGLSERLGIPRSEAKELIDGYFRSYPGVAAYIEKAQEQAREKGYVETAFHRRRRLPDINSRNATVRAYAERNAVNAPLQGTAADIIKIAMIEIDRRMSEQRLESRMILQVHDELVFNVVPSELEELKALVKEAMEGAFTAAVPLTVGIGIGANWLEAH